MKGSYAVDVDLIEEFELVLASLEWTSAEMVVTWSSTIIKWDRLRGNRIEWLAPDQFVRSFYGSTWDLTELNEGSIL